MPELPPYAPELIVITVDGGSAELVLDSTPPVPAPSVPFPEAELSPPPLSTLEVPVPMVGGVPQGVDPLDGTCASVSLRTSHVCVMLFVPYFSVMSTRGRPLKVYW